MPNTPQPGLDLGHLMTEQINAASASLDALRIDRSQAPMKSGGGGGGRTVTSTVNVHCPVIC